MTTATDSADRPGREAVDEELGSPGLTFESAWLVGLLVGITMLLIFLRRHRKRRRGRIAASDSPVPVAN
ncbi:MAG: hypothetical protein ABSC90_07250 [Acidimicrobiales bacterium]